MLLFGNQDPVVLGPLVGDHQRHAGQILVGSLIAPVDPDVDPVFFRGRAHTYGFGPLVKLHRILPEQQDVAGGVHRAS